MLKGFRIARIFNIDIELHWTMVFIAGFIVMSLVGVFEKEFPQSHFLLHWSAAILATVLFLYSILFHEIAHSLVAKKFGILVKRITLFIFGGAAQMDSKKAFESPKTEFLISIAGPISSIFLVAAFFALTIFLRSFVPQLGVFISVFSWVGYINIVLIIFNIIPIFPMDGGRVLRSILWWLTKNVVKATKIAVTITIILSVLLPLGGFLWGGWFSAVWFGFISFLVLIPLAMAEYKLVQKQNTK